MDIRVVFVAMIILVAVGSTSANQNGKEIFIAKLNGPVVTPRPDSYCLLPRMVLFFAIRIASNFKH